MPARVPARPSASASVRELTYASPLSLTSNDHHPPPLTMQGDEEKRLGLPVTPMNDRAKFKSPAHMVCGFIDLVAQGTHDELEKVLPSAVPFAQNSRDNRQKFESLKPADPAPPAEVATAQPAATPAPSKGEAASEAASGAPARVPPGSPPPQKGSGGGGGGWSLCGCLSPASSKDGRFTDDGDKSQST